MAVKQVSSVVAYFSRDHSRLGQVPPGIPKNLWALLAQNFYRPDALLVIQPTALKENNTNYKTHA